MMEYPSRKDLESVLHAGEVLLSNAWPECWIVTMCPSKRRSDCLNATVDKVGFELGLLCTRATAKDSEVDIDVSNIRVYGTGRQNAAAYMNFDSMLLRNVW
ncbi:hypothetical protein HRR83_005968 [Exophiala dermatitidis]|uniref:Uncharacterized protein n=1 Tax=Exophiala dermatitidis TaxID=5970 RepID=A0AAN6EM93_EXODE|nr:hypothetical protein HRR74_008057 [Exophiala dermatitidis]KAJ4517392.1 hypothetical protein HRR73_004444 [Exophiala dermatitidis]KAJ4548859.1 hypothetical protein HRR76_001437 [Exophiala dermatitidis]KAJ4552421.1 hypothetical protein HRR77_002434 [Exophiala dermatitidis]KAJ4568373.1 hypothetical protein HRR79_004599 [Exophiala dermatitidis]